VPQCRGASLGLSGVLASMADRYFVETPITASSTRLAGHEAHHLAHVMRAKPGHEVTLFDGSGAEFSARVTHVGRAEIELEVLDRREVCRELSMAITLGVALPKGDRQRWLVEKATELGAARLVPLVTRRSNDRESPGVLEKLRRAVIEASKQCGRNRLMAIEPPTALESYIEAPHAGLRLIAHPGGEPLVSADPLPGEIALAIGPEGGFTEEEFAAARAAGWTPVGLGSRILRIETAALALLATLAGRVG
jgi:16S rRNA (uracil1498-N3)-methyltransferase